MVVFKKNVEEKQALSGYRWRMSLCPLCFRFNVLVKSSMEFITVPLPLAIQLVHPALSSHG